jgi:hypothetical protein
MVKSFIAFAHGGNLKYGGNIKYHGHFSIKYRSNLPWNFNLGKLRWYFYNTCPRVSIEKPLQAMERADTL